MHKLKFSRILNYGILVIALLWGFFIFLEFWVYHPEMGTSIRIFQYPGLALGLITIGIATSFVVGGIIKKKKSVKWINGSSLFLSSLIIMLILMNSFFVKVFGENLDILENLTFLWSMMKVIVPVYLVLMVCYVSGDWLWKLTSLKLPNKDQDLVKIALGIVIVVFFLFFAGAVDALSPFFLFPLFTIVLLLSFRNSLIFLKITLYNPIRFSKGLNGIGIFSFYVLLVLLSMNTITALRPLPMGYDSLTEYVNLASLVQDYSGLVQGYRPYNWSLFISLGYLLFNQTAVTLGLSFAGSILSLFVFHRLCRKWLDVNMSLLCVLLFYATPMINWLSYRDIKVDMGLLFIALCVILLFYHWAVQIAGSESKMSKQPQNIHQNKPRKSIKKQEKKMIEPTPVEGYLNTINTWIVQKLRKLMPLPVKQNPLPVFIGILIGFAIGIKLPAILLLLVLIATTWYLTGGRLAFMGACALGLCFVFIAKLDAQAGLRALHLSANLVQWVLGFLGAGIFAYLFVKHRLSFLKGLKISIIIGVFTGITLLPWLVKNGYESGNISISALTNGEKASPQPTVEEMTLTWEAQKNSE